MGRMMAFLLALCLPSAAALAFAQDFVLDESVDRFYQPQIYRLPNGLQVVLRQRPEVQKVSIRMVVNLGMDHFACEQSELPHVIEHMLFEGTARYSNAELEQRVADRGASWNAFTEEMQTTYDVEVYAPYIEFALDTLYDVLSNSLMDEAAMSRAVDSAQIESDNAGGLLQLWQALDFGGHGSARLFSEMGFLCSMALDPYQFDYGELQQAFENYYVPANMSIIMVGNFDTDRVRDYLAASFGALPGVALEPAIGVANRHAPSQQRYHSFGVLGLSETADVGIVWQTGGYRGAEYLSLRVLKNYLNTRLYQRLRNEEQLSYSPAVDAYPLENTGIFYLSADTLRGNAQRVLQLLRQELDAIVAGELDQETFEQSRLSLLIGSAMTDLDNSDMADYYSHSLLELQDGAGFWNYERRLMALDYASFIAQLQLFFGAQRGLEYIDKPMFNALGAIVACVAFLVLVMLIVALRIRRRG
jgi:predicted Zn-dependent peptidase